MTVATGVGSMPGDDAHAFEEAVRVVLGEVPDLPHVPEVPGRGAGAEMVGRTLALVTGLAADLQPAGWRLTDATGVDQRRARSLLVQDLDVVEEHTQGFRGRFKVQVTGPWTLAASVEKPRGDKVLADPGARRELAQALAEAVRDHAVAVGRRIPDAELVVQVDEPVLPMVLGGRVPTASGFHRHRSVDVPEASTALEWVLAAAAEAGAVPVVHCCADEVPVALLAGAGAAAVSLDLTRLGAASYDALASLLDEGRQVWLGVVPSLRPEQDPGDRALTERVLRLLDMLGFAPADVHGRLVVTPTCGLAGATGAWARRALALARAVASNLSDV